MNALGAVDSINSLLTQVKEGVSGIYDLLYGQSDPQMAGENLVPEEKGPSPAQEALYGSIFGKGVFVSSGSKSAISGVSMANASMANDLIGNTQSILGQIGQGEQLSLVNPIFSGISSLPVVASDVSSVQQSIASVKKLEKAEDPNSLLLAKLGAAGSVASLCNDVNSIVGNTFSIIGTMHGSSLIGRVSRISSTLGTVIGTIYLGILSVLFGWNLHESSTILTQFNQKESTSEKIEYLISEFGVDEDAVRAKFSSDELIAEAMESAKGHFEVLCQEHGIDLPENVDEVIESLVTANGKSLEEIGLKMKVAKAKGACDAKIGRVFGKSGAKALRRLLDDRGIAFSAKKEIDLNEAQEKLVEKVSRSAKAVRFKKALFLGVPLFGLLTIVVGLTVSAGAGLVIAGVLGLLFGLTISCLDGYLLYQSYRSGQSAKQDANFVIGQIALSLISFIGCLGLSLSGVVTMGILPLVIAGVFTSICTAQGVATLAVMKRNRQIHLNENAPLEYVLDLIRQGSDERLAKALENEKYADLRVDTEDLQDRVEELIQKQNETLAQKAQEEKEQLEEGLASLEVS